MISNYLKIAFRTLWKFKAFASINLIGLSLGLTAGLLIMIYVADELSFDSFHSNIDRIYRVNTKFFNSSGGAEGGFDANAWPVGATLRKDYPEVEAVLYTRSASGLMINHQDKYIRQNIHFASPEFFQIFSFEIMKGNRATALNEPYSLVITEDMEKKFFPGQDALNKTLTIADTLSFVITGVMKNIPSNSHIQLDMVCSMATFEVLNPSFSYDDGWGNINMRNYIMLKPGTDVKAFASKARGIYERGAGQMMKDWGVKAEVEFEPVKGLYLTTLSGNGMGPVGSIERVYLVGGIAFFVILLACINFVNLATARSAYRAREVGLRKVVGSSRAGITRQFLSESFVLTILSFAIAVMLSALVLPLFNDLLAKNYQLTTLLDPMIIAGAIGLILLITLLAGYYPAWIMSSLKPAEVLKGKLQTSKRGVQLRRTLVVFQFVVSISLVVGTLIVVDQLEFMQKRDLGFAKDEVIVVNSARVRSPNPGAFKTFRNELEALASVSSVTHTNALPGSPGWQGQVAYPEGKSGDDAVSVQYMAIDENYISTLNLQLVAGRDFDAARESDADGLILNEAAVALMGWASPAEAIGKRITSPSGYPAGEVIGVVKDYHTAGLQHNIEAVAMDFNPQASHLYAIRYRASDTQQLIESLNSLWKKTFPGFDFNYFFLDQHFEAQYQSEQRLAKVFTLFAMITILIAVIGLLGLVSFMVVTRTKEIGIRKTLGANVGSIVKLLSMEFIVLVVAANIITIPLAWYFAEGWLQKFAYRMAINPLLFVWSLLMALGITMITVSYQTIRAATEDPVKSLRSE